MKKNRIDILGNAKVKETIDIFYLEKYISEREYLASMKFRWLYAQTFGNLSLKAHNYIKAKGRNTYKSEEQLETQAKDFQFIRDILVKENCYQLIFDICILNKTIPQDRMSYYITNLPKALIVLDQGFGELNIKKLGICYDAITLDK